MAKASGGTKKVTASAAAASRTLKTNNIDYQQEIENAKNDLKKQYGSAFDKAGKEEQITYILKNKGLSEAAKDSLKKELYEYKSNVSFVENTIKSLTTSFTKKHFGNEESGFEAFKLKDGYVRVDGDTITRGINVGSKSTSMSKIKNSLTGKMSMNHFQGTDMSKAYSFKITDKTELKKLLNDIASYKK